MRNRPWLVLAVVLVIAGVLVTVRAQQGQDPDWHSSRSDGPKGTSALLLYAAALGRPAHTVQGAFDLPEPPATLFVFDPIAEYSAADADRLRAWVARGGTLVYADENLDGQLSRAFELRRGGGLAPSNATAAVPYFDGVQDIGSGALVTRLRPGPDQAVAFRSGNAAQVLVAGVGSGRLVVLGDPLLLCNGFIGDHDNWRLAAELIQAAPAVAIDEYHHDLGNASGSGDWTRQPVGIGLLAAFLVVFAGVALRNRRFGPRVYPGAGGERSSAEHVQAVGRLLRRFGGRKLAVDLALAATRKSLLARTGISRDATPAQLTEVLKRSSPEVADQWAAAQADAYQAVVSGSDEALVRAARRLHALAYPLASAPPLSPTPHARIRR